MGTDCYHLYKRGVENLCISLCYKKIPPEGNMTLATVTAIREGRRVDGMNQETFLFGSRVWIQFRVLARHALYTLSPPENFITGALDFFSLLKHVEILHIDTTVKTSFKMVLLFFFSCDSI